MIKGVITTSTAGFTKQGAPYTVVTLTDIDYSKVKTTLWNSKPDDYKVGWYLEISNPKIDERGNATASTSSGITICKIVPEGYEKFVPKIPTSKDWEVLCQSIVADMEAYGIKHEWILFFTKNMTRLYDQYSQYPAATSMHHCYPGGLAQHTYECLNVFRGMYGALPWSVNPFVIYLSILFHDMGKLFEYNKDGSRTKMIDFKYHTVSSSEMIGALMRKEEIFENSTITHVQHCILAHHGKKEYGSPVEPATLEAFLVHECDAISGNGTTIYSHATPAGTKVMNQTYYVV